MSSTIVPGAEPTPLPARPINRPDDDPSSAQQPIASDSENGKPPKDGLLFNYPKLRLKIRDLNHPGANRFLGAVNAASILRESVQTVLSLLYISPANTEGLIPPGTRSVTLYLEDMPGVAYTKGSDLDDDHKEIHFSLRYINGIKKAPDGANGDITGAYEIKGVLVHELVHCFQYNGKGHCPGGLVEGIADWVRLHARLGAPHWRRDVIPEKWDAGYEKTAYFLEFLEDKYGEGLVRRINEALREERYRKDDFWVDLLGKKVDDLWKEYVKVVKGR